MHPKCRKLPHTSYRQTETGYSLLQSQFKFRTDKIRISWVKFFWGQRRMMAIFLISSCLAQDSPPPWIALPSYLNPNYFSVFLYSVFYLLQPLFFSQYIQLSIMLFDIITFWWIFLPNFPYVFYLAFLHPD